MTTRDGFSAEDFFTTPTGYAYNDFIILPGFIDFAPDDVSLETNLTKNIKLLKMAIKSLLK